MENLVDLKVLNIKYEGAKGDTQEAHQPVETPNNLISVAKAKVLLALGEGEFAERPTERDIYLNGTPLMNPDGSTNFGGVKWDWRSGLALQEYIQGMPDVSSEESVGVELKASTPWVRYVANSSLSACRITFQWSALMQQLDNGDTVGYRIEYAVDLSTDGGPYVEYGKYEVDGKNNSVYERTLRIDFPKSTSGWSVRVRRITPNSESSLVQDAMNIKSFSEVVDAKQFYPNTALLFVEFDSRSFSGGSIPRISVRQKGRVIRVPSNYDPVARSYSGIWDGVFKWAWTNNPAWVFYDIVTTARFGLGNRIDATQIDKWELYDIARWCDVPVDNGDGSGKTEPRHTCNIYIQSQNDAWTVLRDICSIFNGMTYWDGSKFIARADKQESLQNIPLFNTTNVVNGDFNFEAPDERTIATSALISYDDPDNHYNTAVEAVWEQSEMLRWGGDKQTEIAAIGCTSRGEAQRKGKYNLLTNMHNRTVNFSTGFQALDEKIFPGKVIGVADPLIAGVPFTGRITAAVPRVVTLDRETEAKAGDVLFLTNSKGVQEGRTVESVALNGRIITTIVPYTETGIPNNTWYLEASDLKHQLFRVTKVVYNDNHTALISGVEYVDGKYATIDNGARLEERPISKVPPQSQKSVGEVLLTSYVYVEQTMAVTSLVISWPQTPNAIRYEIEWRVGSSDWVPAGQIGATEIEIKGVYTGYYVARVRAINAVDVKSVWTYSQSTQIKGKTGTPPAVTSLTVDSLLFGMGLKWTFPEGAEDTARTEIWYSMNPSFAAGSKLGDYAYPQSDHEIHGLAAGQRMYFWARLVDRTGNIGPWYPSSSANGILGTSALNDNGQYNDYFAGMIAETALDKTLHDKIEKIPVLEDLMTGDGPGSVNERINDAVVDLEQQIANITDAMLYDPTRTYQKGEIVRVGNFLYQALSDVPLDTTPPNIVYWKDVGEILEDADALAAQVNINTVNIERLDGKVTSTATSIDSLQAAYRDLDPNGELTDAIVGWDSRAFIIEERVVRANSDEAFAQRLVTVQAHLDGNSAAISTLETTTATADAALAERIDLLQVKVDQDITAAIQTESIVRANADEALGTRIELVRAEMTNNNATIYAAIQTETTARVNADGALSSEITQLRATMGTVDEALNAALNNEATARVSGDTALAQWITSLQQNFAKNSRKC